MLWVTLRGLNAEDTQVRRIRLGTQQPALRRFESGKVHMEHCMPAARKFTAELNRECVTDEIMNRNSHRWSPSSVPVAPHRKGREAARGPRISGFLCPLSRPKQHVHLEYLLCKGISSMPMGQTSSNAQDRRRSKR